MPETPSQRTQRITEANHLLDSGAHEQAEALLMSWLRDDAECISYYELLGSALRGQGRQREIIPLLEAASESLPELPLWRCPDYSLRQQDARAKGLPSIFLNTQFKSGSVFLRDAFYNGLGLAWQFLFPEGVAAVMVESWMRRFAQGGAVCQDHRHCTEEFGHSLTAMPGIKLVVHLRDPRQSQLSVVHHYGHILREGPDYARRNLLREMPAGYENWSLERRLDLQFGLCPEFDDCQMTRMHQNLEGQIHWIERWLEAIEGNLLPITPVVTDYDDLAGGQEQFLRLLLERLGIDPSLFDFSTVAQRPEPGTSHFRRGDPNEWRETLTRRQHDRARALLTPRVRMRYDS